jgi:hypothetical protein
VRSTLGAAELEEAAMEKNTKPSGRVSNIGYHGEMASKEDGIIKPLSSFT